MTLLPANRQTAQFLYNSGVLKITTGYICVFTSEQRSRGQCIVIDTVGPLKTVSAVVHLTRKFHYWMLGPGLLALPAISGQISPTLDVSHLCFSVTTISKSLKC